MKQTYDINGVKVRAQNQGQAMSLAKERVDDPSFALNNKTLTDATPFAITPPKPATQADGLLGLIEANTSAFTANQQAQADLARQKEETSFEQYMKAALSSEGEVALTDRAYKETVDPAAEELQDINQQIIAEQVALQRRIEALEKNPHGMFGGALEQEIEQVKTESIRRQADLSVIQMAKQGKYDSAKAIADRAIQAQLEKQRLKLDAFQLNYERNKELFDQAEQRAFESAQFDRETAYQMEQQRLKEISNLSLEALANGAPAALVKQMREALTPEDAIALGGQYIGLLDRQQMEFNQSLQLQQLDISRANLAVAQRSQQFEETKYWTDWATEQVKAKKLDQKTVQSIRSANDQINNAIGAISAVNTKMKNDEGFSPAVGAGFKKTFLSALPFIGPDPVAGTKRADFVAEVNRLKATLTLPALQQMRGFGALSDVEFNTVANSASSLTTDMSEQAFRVEMERITSIMNIAKARSQAQIDVTNGIASIPVIAPDGVTVGTIPAEELNEALAEGYQVIE